MYRTTSTHAQDTNTHTHTPLLHTRVFSPRQYNIRSPLPRPSPTPPHSSPLSEPVFISTWTFHCVCVSFVWIFQAYLCGSVRPQERLQTHQVAQSLTPHVMLLFFFLVFPHHVFFFVPVLPSSPKKKQAETVCMNGRKKIDTCDLLFFSRSFLLIANILSFKRSEAGSFRRESSRPCSSLNKVSLMFNHLIVDVEPQSWDKTPSWWHHACSSLSGLFACCLSPLIHLVSMWLTLGSGSTRLS